MSIKVGQIWRNKEKGYTIKVLSKLKNDLWKVSAHGKGRKEHSMTERSFHFYELVKNENLEPLTEGEKMKLVPKIREIFNEKIEFEKFFSIDDFIEICMEDESIKASTNIDRRKISNAIMTFIYLYMKSNQISKMSDKKRNPTSKKIYRKVALQPAPPAPQPVPPVPPAPQPVKPLAKPQSAKPFVVNYKVKSQEPQLAVIKPAVIKPALVKNETREKLENLYQKFKDVELKDLIEVSVLYFSDLIKRDQTEDELRDLINKNTDAINRRNQTIRSLMIFIKKQSVEIQRYDRDLEFLLEENEALRKREQELKNSVPEETEAWKSIKLHELI